MSDQSVDLMNMLGGADFKVGGLKILIAVFFLGIAIYSMVTINKIKKNKPETQKTKNAMMWLLFLVSLIAFLGVGGWGVLDMMKKDE
jgi:hypothetical protein